MKANILLLGADGQIGWELRRSLLTVGDVHAVTRKECDLVDQVALKSIYDSISPNIIVNAAAYTAVDSAETEPQLALALNRDLPVQLAGWCQRDSTLLVDYSTDYVFDGSGTEPYAEEDSTDPINHYGHSKLAGLKAIQESGCRHLVFRVSWVYSARRNNFAKTILRLAGQRDSLNVIDDQIGTPCSARWIADMTSTSIHFLNQGIGSEGVFHLTPGGETSWYEFAKLIVENAVASGFELKLESKDINPIPTTQYPTPAQRPNNSRLNKNKFCEAFGLPLGDWSTMVSQTIQEISINDREGVSA